MATESVWVKILPKDYDAAWRLIHTYDLVQNTDFVCWINQADEAGEVLNLGFYDPELLSMFKLRFK